MIQGVRVAKRNPSPKRNTLETQGDLFGGLGFSTGEPGDGNVE